MYSFCSNPHITSFNCQVHYITLLVERFITVLLQFHVVMPDFIHSCQNIANYCITHLLIPQSFQVFCVHIPSSQFVCNHTLSFDFSLCSMSGLGTSFRSVFHFKFFFVTPHISLRILIMGPCILDFSIRTQVSHKITDLHEGHFYLS